jgi:hypothetical protein
VVLRSIEGIVVLLGGGELAEPGPLDGVKEGVTVIVISEITNGKVANQTSRATGRYILTRRDVE